MRQNIFETVTWSNMKDSKKHKRVIRNNIEKCDFIQISMHTKIETIHRSHMEKEICAYDILF